MATDLRKVSANKANPNKPLQLFVQGEGVVVEWPSNIKNCHKSAWLQFSDASQLVHGFLKANQVQRKEDKMMFLGHSTTTPSPWTKSSKGLLGFALFADKFLMSVAPFDVHPWNRFYTLNSIFELFWKNSSYVSGVSVCIFVSLYVRMFVARAIKVEGTMSRCLGTNEILAST